MSDIFSKRKRSAVMAAIRSRGNTATELRLIAVFRAQGGVDRSRPCANFSGMSSKKPLLTAERPTAGTVIAGKNRAKMNGLGDEQRAALLARGMQLIYGATRPAKAAAGRR